MEPMAISWNCDQDIDVVQGLGKPAAAAPLGRPASAAGKICIRRSRSRDLPDRVSHGDTLDLVRTYGRGEPGDPRDRVPGDGARSVRRSSAGASGRAFGGLFHRADALKGG